MSASYTVKSVGDPREWESPKYNKRYLAYPVDLEDENGTLSKSIEWSRNEDSNPPQVGDEVIATIQNSPHGEKLKVDWDAMKEKNGGGSSSTERSSGGGKKWQPESERDPERSARILRQHSQEMALRAATSAGYFKGEITLQKLHDDITPLIDWFDNDVNEAGQAASQGAGAQSQTPSSPSDSALGGSASAPDSQPAGPSLEEMEQALDTAGIFGKAAKEITAYMVGNFTAEQSANAVSKLTTVSDIETQANALASLKTLTEKWQGKPLSADESDDSVPF